MKQTLSASVWQEGDWFVAQCLEVDVASQGETEAEAIANLVEAIELHFEPPVATVVRQVRKIEVAMEAVLAAISTTNSGAPSIYPRSSKQL